MILESIFLERK